METPLPFTAAELDALFSMLYDFKGWKSFYSDDAEFITGIGAFSKRENVYAKVLRAKMRAHRQYAYAHAHSAPVTEGQT